MKLITIANLAAIPIGLFGLLSEVKWIQIVCCSIAGSIFALGWYVDVCNRAKEVGKDE